MCCVAYLNSKQRLITTLYQHIGSYENLQLLPLNITAKFNWNCPVGLISKWFFFNYHKLPHEDKSDAPQLDRYQTDWS